MEYAYHLPVLPRETIEGLNIDPAGTYVDATLGGGGHSALIAQKLTAGRLICLDRDADAIAEGEKRLAGYTNITFIKTDFRNMRDALKYNGIERIDGALFDLGVSSHQLDDAERGFSYMQDAPLDMRMDREQNYSAHNFINEAEEAEIARVLYVYGEERFSRQIAAAIIKARPVDSTLQLADIIRSAMPAAARREKQHPAKRSFQGIRIFINSELEAAKEGVQSAFELLSPGGRLAVITFHSLEDRLIKEDFAALAKGCECPPSFPVCVCGRTPLGKIINRKPIVAQEEEITANPRARSAKLRVIEKL